MTQIKFKPFNIDTNLFTGYVHNEAEFRKMMLNLCPYHDISKIFNEIRSNKQELSRNLFYFQPHGISILEYLTQE